MARGIIKKIGKHSLLTLFVVFSLTACSGAKILNSITPKTGYTVYSNIDYGTQPRQKLDIYVPEKITNPQTTLVFFYGGSWQSGSKDEYRFVGQAFASQGFITVIVDYRLYPPFYFPTFINDSANAFVWVHQHIQTYGGDPNHLFLIGHSAGAYNAVMLTVNDSTLIKAGGKRSWIKGTIGIAGPYDFLPFTDPKIKAIFSKANDTDTQPIHFVKAGLPPMLLLTGNEDTEVYPKNSIHLYQKLRLHNDPAELIIYPNIGHIGIIVSLAYGFRNKAPMLTDITQFVHKTSFEGNYDKRSHREKQNEG